MARKEGYYWIKTKNNTRWMIAEWNWWQGGFLGDNTVYRIDDIAEIDECQIVREQKATNEPQALPMLDVSSQGERFCFCSNGRNLFERDGKYYCEQCFGLWQQNRC